MADRYWVGGSATWDGTAGTKWALTSGGAGGQAVPDLPDDVYLDAASGAVTVTVSGTRNLRNFITTGFTGTLSGTASPLLAYGGPTITLGSGMTWNSANGPAMANAGSATTLLTTNGVAMRGFSIATSSGTVILQDNLTMNGILAHTFGVFDANDFNISAQGFSSASGGTRTLSMGNGTWTLGGSTTVALLNTGTVTGFTYNAEGATIIFNPSDAVGYTINNGSWNITNPVTILAAGAAAARITFTNSATAWENVTVLGPNRLYLAGGLVFTTLVLNGEPTGPILIATSTVGTARALAVGSTVTGSYVVLHEINKSGAGTIVLKPAYQISSTAATANVRTPAAATSVGI